MKTNKSELLKKLSEHQKYMEGFKEEVMSTIKHYVDKYGKETEHGYFVSAGQGAEKLVKCMVKKVSAANYIERRGIEDTPKTRYDLERAYGVSGYDKFSANAIGYDEKGVLCVFGGHGGKCKVSDLKAHELPQLATWVVNMCED